MIRILLLDDHHAIRTGLTAVLQAEPGFVPVAAVATEQELAPALYRTRPDVVMLDYHLPSSDGLILCRRLKREVNPPAVLLYSAYGDAQLAIPAIVAGADGLLHKSAPAVELYDAIRRVARGESLMPPVPRELLDAANAALETDQIPILGLILDGTPLLEIASTLRRRPADVSEQIDRMVERLRVPVPTPVS